MLAETYEAFETAVIFYIKDVCVGKIKLKKKYFLEYPRIYIQTYGKNIYSHALIKTNIQLQDRRREGQ